MDLEICSQRQLLYQILACVVGFFLQVDIQAFHQLFVGDEHGSPLIVSIFLLDELDVAHVLVIARRNHCIYVPSLRSYFGVLDHQSL